MIEKSAMKAGMGEVKIDGMDTESSIFLCYNISSIKYQLNRDYTPRDI
jgi:hypothetical protein